MKAVIRTDIYECPEQVALIKRRLEEHGIQSIFYSTASQLPDILESLKAEGDRPFLHYLSPWEWVDFPDQIIKLHEENLGFENTASEYTGERFTYIPSRVFVHNDQLLNFKEKHGTVFTFLLNISKTVSRPQVEAPRIILTSHNRNQYLELTLNSLLFSLDESVPITLLLNDATKEVKALASRVKRDNFDILEIERNCFYSSVNLAVQWYKPKVFIVAEDDFILPPTAKEIYPDWAYHFVQRLNHCDLVGWSPSVDNAPTEHRFHKDRNPIGEWTHAGKAFSRYTVLLGNCLAMKLDFWLEALRSSPIPWYTPLDSNLHKLARSYCTPSLKGYHIGWNQQVDGFGSLMNREFTPPMENKVTNIKTGETRYMRLDSILEPSWRP